MNRVANNEDWLKYSSKNRIVYPRQSELQGRLFESELESLAVEAFCTYSVVQHPDMMRRERF